MTNVAVTGANGFVGSELCTKLVQQTFRVRRVVRESNNPSLGEISVGPIGPDTNWKNILDEVDVVVHLAARVHMMQAEDAEQRKIYREVNFEGTMALARQSVHAGVKRFIFISSIKVNGEKTIIGEPFTADDVPKPMDPYGVSKAETEQALLELAASTGLEVVIVRPVLVYGPGVKANFRSLMKWLNTGVPLPFGAVNNKRSLVALDNLVSFIIHCLDHPKATNEVFLISDGEDVSTTELLQKVAKAFGKRPFLIPVPVSLMRFAAKLLGKGDVADRLFGSLQVDSSKARDLLGWKPVISMDDQLKKITKLKKRR